jgi:hypothetical protein
VEILVEGNASLAIYDTAARIVNKVLRDHRLVSVSQDTLEATLEVSARDGLFRADGQIYQGNVSGRDTHSHSGQLSIELRDNLSYRLGGSGRSRDQVGQCGTSRTPILATLARSINDKLGRGACSKNKNTVPREEIS